MGKCRRLAGKLFERCGALCGWQLILNGCPALLDLGKALLIAGIQRRPGALAEQTNEHADGRFVHGLRSSFAGFWLRRRISGRCLRKPRSTRLGSRVFKRTKKRSGQPRYRSR
ncbi:hypothetical protein D3C75_1142500 [compost metagenome]